jgi:hypothetical protein
MSRSYSSSSPSSSVACSAIHLAFSSRVMVVVVDVLVVVIKW